MQFRNNFLANFSRIFGSAPMQFSKHSVSFMQFSEPYVILTQSSESAQCRLDLHLFQADKLHGTYTFTRYQGNAMERPFSISALGSVCDVAQKKYITLWIKFTKIFVRKQITRQRPEQDIFSVCLLSWRLPAWCTLSNMKLPAAETDYWSGISWSREISWINPLRA
jgi:hypothetical protein